MGIVEGFFLNPLTFRQTRYSGVITYTVLTIVAALSLWAFCTDILNREGIPYAVIGAMALNEFGYRRVTVAVDVLLTPEELAAFKSRHLGRTYIEKFPGSRGVRDAEHGVILTWS